MTTAEEFNKFLEEEEIENQAIKAYAVLEIAADALVKVVQNTKGLTLPLSKEIVMTTLIFSSNPLIDQFSPEVQKGIRFIYYKKGLFLDSMAKLGEIMGSKANECINND